MEISGFFSWPSLFKVDGSLFQGQPIFHSTASLHMDGTLYKLTLLSAAANFVSTVAPSVGMGGVVVFFSDASRNGQSPGKITVISVLYFFLDYIAFLFVLTLGLIVLFRRNDLGPGEIAASAVIFGIAFALGSLLYLGSRSATALGNALAWMARLVNRVVYPFLHHDYLSEARAHEFAHEMAADLKSLPERPRSLIKPMLLAFANKALHDVRSGRILPGFSSPIFHRDDHWWLRHFISISDRFANPLRHWHRGGHYAAGLIFTACSVERGGGHYARLSRRHILVPTGRSAPGLSVVCKCAMK